MEKMKRLKRSLANQGNKNRSIKKGLGVFLILIKRMFKSRPTELDQLVNYKKIISYSSRKKHSESILYKEGDEVQTTNWIYKINSKSPYFNRGNLKNEVSIKEKKGMILLVLLQK